MNIRSHLDTAPELGQRVYVDQTAVVIGRVRVGDDASFWFHAAARGLANPAPEIPRNKTRSSWKLSNPFRDASLFLCIQVYLFGAGRTVGLCLQKDLGTTRPPHSYPHNSSRQGVQ